MSTENLFFVSPRVTIGLHRGSTIRWRAIPGPRYTCCYLLDGRAEANVRGKNITVERGCLLLFDPTESGSVSGKSCAIIVLDFAPSFMLDFAIRMHLSTSEKQISFRDGVSCGDIRFGRIAGDLAEEMRNEQVGKEASITTLVDQLVIHLLRHQGSLRKSDALELSRVGMVDRRLRRAIELMHSNLDRELLIRDMAAAAYLSAFHFSRLFKKVTGTTPHGYLSALRSSKARTLLAETDLSITDIASRVGYSGSSHFTKAFRESTGMSPSAFRNSIVGLTSKY